MSEIEIDLRRYWRALARNWQILIPVALLGALVGLYLAWMRPTVYEARTGVIIIRSRIALTLDQNVRMAFAPDVGGQSGIDVRRTTLVSLIRNPSLAQLVAQRTKGVLPPRYSDPVELIGMVDAQAPRGSEIIEIIARGEEREVLVPIADLWAEEFVKYVNQIYAATPPIDLLRREVGAAQGRYTAAQAAVEQSIGESRINRLTQEIDVRRKVIAALQEGRQLAATAVLRKEIETRGEIVGTQLRSALTAASLPLTKQAEKQVEMLSRSYDAWVKTQLLLEDARGLQRQLRQSGDATASNATALLMLKLQSFASSTAVPASLNLQVGEGSQSTIPAAAIASDLDSLIRALERRLQDLDAAIDRQSNDLMSTGGLSGMVGLGTRTNPLLVEAQRLGRELLEFKGLDHVLDQLGNDTALDVTRDRLTVELQRLERELVEEQTKQAALTRERDLTLEAYLTLRRKAEETQINSQFPGAEIAVARPAAWSALPQVRSNPIVQFSGPIVVAVGIGVVLIVAAEVVAPGFSFPPLPVMPGRRGLRIPRRFVQAEPAESVESAAAGGST
ncbi:MAG: hypothetical protein HY331_11625 [Chloroflexi bacterium]|nr:hypothetical protein [Chloroflexota bacterium]